ncbi:MAG: TSUP family transporter, partial [Lachnospiraceae bacterium]
VLQSVVCGMGVGLICGFVGAGGGMLMLLVLVSILGYELKTAVGTSVFIMTFTAFTGAVSHFVIGDGITDYSILIMCIIFTLLGAIITSKFANKTSPKIMNQALGFGLAAMSIVMIIVNFIV